MAASFRFGVEFSRLSFLRHSHLTSLETTRIHSAPFVHSGRSYCWAGRKCGSKRKSQEVRSALAGNSQNRVHYSTSTLHSRVGGATVHTDLCYAQEHALRVADLGCGRHTYIQGIGRYFLHLEHLPPMLFSPPASFILHFSKEHVLLLFFQIFDAARRGNDGIDTARSTSDHALHHN